MGPAIGPGPRWEKRNMNSVNVADRVLLTLIWDCNDRDESLNATAQRLAARVESHEAATLRDQIVIALVECGQECRQPGKTQAGTVEFDGETVYWWRDHTDTCWTSERPDWWQARKYTADGRAGQP